MRLLIVLLIGAAFFFLQGLIFRKNWHKGVNVDIDFEKNTVREGDKNTLIEVIKNDKILPLPVVLVKFSMTRTFLFSKESNASVTDQYYRKEYFSCRPYQMVTRKYAFTASKRGQYSLSSFDLICKDYFFKQNVFASLKHFASVLVLPGRIREGEIPKNFLPLSGEIISRIKLTEDPFSFLSVREYQPYDPMNHINWKATAKNASLFVNTFHTTNKRNVVLLLNLETESIRRGETIAEAAIKIASFLTAHFITEQIPVALYSNGTDCETGEKIAIEAGCDEGHIRQIDVALARLKVADFYDPFTKLMEECVEKEDTENEYIIISNNRSEEILKLFTEFKAEGHKMTFLVPEYTANSIKPLVDNGMDIIKWGIDYEE